MGSGLGSVVEHTLHNPEFVDVNPAWNWAFLLCFSVIHPRIVPHKGAALLISLTMLRCKAWVEHGCEREGELVLHMQFQ